MARKINGPFGDVSITSIGHQGSTCTNEDVFFHLMASETRELSDAFSSPQGTNMVERIARRASLHTTSHTTRDTASNNAHRLDAFIRWFS